MRPIAALLLLAASPALAADVRVKSKHETAAVDGSPATFYQLGPEETLRGAAIGPGSVVVVLRRVGAKPLPVKLVRDGREVAKLTAAGKGKDKLSGKGELAAPAQEKTIDLPPGPHTLFIEAGKGEGYVLVGFHEPPAAPPASARKEPKDKEPKLAKAEAADAKAEPKVAIAPLVVKKEASAEAEPAIAPLSRKGKGGPAGQKKEAAKADEPAAADKPSQAEPAVAEKAAPEKVAAADQPAFRPAGRLSDDEEIPPPTTPAISASSPTSASGPTSAASSMSAPTSAAPSREAARLRAGARLGAASQLQMGASGPAIGASARYGLGGSLSNLSVGASLDYFHYGFSFQAGRTASLPALSRGASLNALPLLAEASWAFRPLTSLELSPFAALSAGGVLCLLSESGSLAPASSATGFSPALSLAVGAELPLGRDRLGLELRYLMARSSALGSLRSLEVGGLLAQASWRFGM